MLKQTLVVVVCFVFESPLLKPRSIFIFIFIFLYIYMFRRRSCNRWVSEWKLGFYKKARSLDSEPSKRQRESIISFGCHVMGKNHFLYGPLSSKTLFNQYLYIIFFSNWSFYSWRGNNSLHQTHELRKAILFLYLKKLKKNLFCLEILFYIFI